MGVIEVKQAKETISNILRDSKEITVKKIDSIKGPVSSMIETIQSEDSNLAASLTKYNESLTNCSLAMSAVFGAMDAEWNIFCEKSIKNEEELDAKVQEESNTLEELSDSSADIMKKYTTGSNDNSGGGGGSHSFDPPEEGSTLRPGESGGGASF